MRILIHDNDAAGWCKALAQRLPGAELATSTDDGDMPADYLVAWKPPARLYASQACLKGIINLGAGVDALLADPAFPRDVPVVKLRDAGMGPLMADYVRYGVLYFQRNFDRYLAQEADAQWRVWPSPDKSDWAIGVLGLGAIGRHVAQSLAADGFPVHGWSRSPKSVDGVACHHGSEGLSALLAEVTTLVTLLPGTASTRGIVNQALLAQLPEGASLINPGRGALVDGQALLDAVGTAGCPGRLRGAILDVFPEEPLPAASALWHHPRIRITPHVSAPTPIQPAADQVASAILAIENGEPLETVDIEAGY